MLIAYLDISLLDKNWTPSACPLATASKRGKTVFSHPPSTGAQTATYESSVRQVSNSTLFTASRPFVTTRSRRNIWIAEHSTLAQAATCAVLAEMERGSLYPPCPEFEPRQLTLTLDEWASNIPRL